MQSLHLFCLGYLERRRNASDLGMFLVGQVYPLAAYATALTHLLQPICQDASCSWRSGGSGAARGGAAGESSLLLPEDCVAGKEKCITEAAKSPWKRCAPTKGEEDPDAA